MKELQALIHLVITIVLLTLGLQLIAKPDLYTPIHKVYIMTFSLLYSFYCYKDKLNSFIRNKDDT